MQLNGDQECFEKGDDFFCFIMKEVSIGEGLDWQHIRNEFYKAMPESFGEVSGFVLVNHVTMHAGWAVRRFMLSPPQTSSNFSQSNTMETSFRRIS